MKKVIAKIKEDKRGYKRVSVPKQRETNSWKDGDLVELNKVKVSK